MKKTIYLSILTIVTAACIILGCIFNLGLFHFKSGSSILKQSTTITSGKSSDTISVDAFKNMDINCEVMDIKIESGNAFEVSYNCSDNAIPTVSVEKDTLVIKQKVAKKLMNNIKGCHLVITIPANTDLDKVSVTSNVGDIKIEGQKAENFNVSLNVGDIELDNLSGKSMKIENNTGDVKCDGCDIKEVNIDNNVGDVSYIDSTDLTGYSMDLSTDIGEVKVSGEGHGKNFSQKGSDGKIRIETNIGDVKVN